MCWPKFRPHAGHSSGGVGKRGGTVSRALLCVLFVLLFFFHGRSVLSPLLLPTTSLDGYTSRRMHTAVSHSVVGR